MMWILIPPGFLHNIIMTDCLFGAQIANSSYTKSGYDGYRKAHFLTKYKVNDHLSLKNKIVKNFDVDEIQGEVGVVLNPLKDTDRLELK